ncbi:MAG: ABC transporter permease [Methanothrix sp.]|nr:ABC transporter permease [Methanothrix sp.]
MKWHDEVRGIYEIALKDMRTYYLKPPAISWGMVFPLAWTLAFYLRNPGDFADLVPGLLAMTIVFSTTAAEAVVINFELRLGTLERLLLAPISMTGVLLGKVMGGFLFGLIMTAIVAAGAVLALGLRTDILSLSIISLLSLLVFSSMGALFSVSVREVFEAQTLLNLPRFLMVFLCGVVYPISALPEGLQLLSRLLPLTYTVQGLKASFFQGAEPSMIRDLAALSLFLFLFLLPAVSLLKRRFR